MPQSERRITLRAIDDLWADYLCTSRGLPFGGAADLLERPRRASRVCDPSSEWFGELEAALAEEIARRVDSPGEETADRGAVWTYLTTDQPFGNLTERLARGGRG